MRRAAHRLRRACDLCLARGRRGADRGQVRRLDRHRLGRAAVEPGRTRWSTPPPRWSTFSRCGKPIVPRRPRAPFWPRQGRAAGRRSANRPFSIGSAMLLMAEAVRRLVSPDPVADAPAGIAVMVFSIAVTLGAHRLSAPCGAADQVARDRRRRTALPQRPHFQSRRHRRVTGAEAPRSCRCSIRCSAARSASGSFTAR